MQSRRVGASGLEVSRLGLGTMGWAETTDEHEARAILDRYLDSGGSLIDTAAGYADGRTESLVGRLLSDAGCRHRVTLATKAGLGGKHRPRDTSRGAMLDSLEGSLRRLRTDHVDLWQVHVWDAHTPVEETIAALQSAVQCGKARYIGVSNFNAWQTVWAQQAAREGVPIVSNQREYSLLNRGIEPDLVDAAEAMRVGIVAWSPLGRGVLTGKYRFSTPGDSRAASPWQPFVEPYLNDACAAVVDGLAKAAEGLDLPLSHVALGWLLAKPFLTSALLGARTVEQANELFAAADVELPDAIVGALDDVSEGLR